MDSMQSEIDELKSDIQYLKQEVKKCDISETRGQEM